MIDIDQLLEATNSELDINEFNFHSIDIDTLLDKTADW
ncbi:hypothetical protein JOC77_002538 [Peribacillus deserti]|uniref:Uncharacterized protein n=1 Tax=Peribacillus deserti TaxID=673318 RepID=A0ABS2QIZ6_9BACI|nr:hypothetical protein [Peribacillus deserti]